ncbi:hypothetical protein E6O75_ATG00674 [Venturia nashicola]|uniref:Uncharacterized protein n=1 Tax=Venturia nashicola TaxID=86259 RepID=A0A4Z1PIZ0_9PEZI|nr:hypothetical protein E6O75_ATG00674 [Venturia nashicola]
MPPTIPPPWVPAFAPTYPPTQHWYESKIKLQAHYIEESHTWNLKLENEVSELQERLQVVTGHARELATENKELESEVRGRVVGERVLRKRVRAMREVRIELEREERGSRGGRLRELGAERKARRLERENRKLKEKIEGLEARLTGEDEVLGDEGRDVATENVIEVGGGEEMEGGVEVGVSGICDRNADVC